MKELKEEFMIINADEEGEDWLLNQILIQVPTLKRMGRPTCPKLLNPKSKTHAQNEEYFSTLSSKSKAIM